MERLKLEDLARLVDEQPTPEEQAALDADDLLRRELEAMKAQRRELDGLPDPLPPPGGWHKLESELAATGLIRGPVAGSPWRRWLQAAAALALFLGGTAIGWVTGSGSSVDGEAAAGESAVGTVADGAAAPASLDDARLAVEDAEREWRRAYGDYRQLFYAVNGQQPTRDPAARLAGIEALVAVGKAAVQQSPEDEFLNSFLVRTVMEREQAIRQISLVGWH